MNDKETIFGHIESSLLKIFFTQHNENSNSNAIGSIKTEEVVGTASNSSSSSDSHSDHSSDPIHKDDNFIQFSIITLAITTVAFIIMFFLVYFCNKDLLLKIFSKISDLFRKTFNRH